MRENLADDGIFVMDLYGGPEATVEQEELRSLGGGIEYVWDQREYLPGTGQFLTAIHFRFRDGSELTNAFEYDWRFWHLGEIRDVLYDAGFSDVTTWFEGTDPEDEDEGDEDEPTARGEIVGGEVARDVGSERLRSVLTIDSATSGGDSDPERLAKRRARRRAAKRRHERRLREGVFT